MKPRTITAIVVLSAVLLLGAYDIWAYFTYSEATISEWFWKWGQRTFLLPFSAGVLCGHLFLPGRAKEE